MSPKSFHLELFQFACEDESILGQAREGRGRGREVCGLPLVFGVGVAPLNNLLSMLKT